MGEVIMAIKAASDEYLNNKAIISQVRQAAMPTIQLAAISIPKVVAIPFPPLNRSQTGKLWPNTKSIPDNIIKGIKLLSSE